MWIAYIANEPKGTDANPKGTDANFVNTVLAGCNDTLGSGKYVTLGGSSRFFK